MCLQKVLLSFADIKSQNTPMRTLADRWSMIKINQQPASDPVMETMHPELKAKLAERTKYRFSASAGSWNWTCLGSDKMTLVDGGFLELYRSCDLNGPRATPVLAPASRL